MTFEIIIVTNTFSDLSLLDFSFEDIYILDIESKEFKDYIHSLNESLGEHNFNFFTHIIKDSTDISDNKRYAIFKRNFDENFDSNKLRLVYELLLIVFPSEFIIEHIVSFLNEGGVVQKLSMTSWPPHFSYEFEYLHFMDDKLEQINNFFKLVFSKIKQDDYIRLGIDHYINGYSASHLHFQYITFCMALECIVSGANEVSYRLRRGAAVLCGNTVEEGRLIFKNLNDVYSLRSKIVHGEDFDIRMLRLNLAYLIPFISLLIIELLIHDIDLLILNERVTEVGYGMRNQISEQWVHFNMNPLVYAKLKRIGDLKEWRAGELNKKKDSKK